MGKWKSGVHALEYVVETPEEDMLCSCLFDIYILSHNTISGVHKNTCS